jgi:hypothetical protein
MFIQLDLYMPQSDLSPYRDLHQWRQHQKCLGETGSPTETTTSTQKLCALKRFQLTPQPAFQHPSARLDIIRKECLSFYLCSFEAPSLRYGPDQGSEARAIPSTLGSSQARNLVNPRNRGSQIGLGLLPKPTHSLSSVGGHGGGYGCVAADLPLLSRSARSLPEAKPVYGSVGSLTLATAREIHAAQILRPTPGSL